MWSKMLPASKPLRCLNQLYIKNNINFYWGVAKNVLGKSNLRILESIISQVKTDESTQSVACRYRFKKYKR